MSSINRLQSRGDRIAPCLTPLDAENAYIILVMYRVQLYAADLESYFLNICSTGSYYFHDILSGWH